MKTTTFRKIANPCFQYFGGKFKYAERIISHFPWHQVYVEPFGGAASVLLKKPEAKIEIYNDLNEDIVNFFRVLREPEKSQKLLYKLKLTPYSRQELVDCSDGVETPDDVEKARRFVVRVSLSFNNNPVATRGFNCSINKGKARRAFYFRNYINNLNNVINRFKNIIIECRNIFYILKQYDTEQTLFYLDPPYLQSARENSSKEYRAYEFDEKQHIKLADALKEIKGMAVVSGYRSELYDRLYVGWRRDEFQGYARSGADARLEALWLSPNIPEKDDKCRLTAKA
jgi:DNA adenine methylase